MSTRSIIARVGKAEGEFSGVYAHWDGMPRTRGPLLWKILHEEFNGDLKAALVYLIDEHRAGWSSLDHRNCYCHPHLSKDADHKGRKPERANIFTHADVVTGKTDIEWLYAFDEERNRLFVRDISHDAESLIELSEPEPDWAVVECGEELERCRHYAWFHGLLPKTSNLSTQAWLGNRPLEFRDAVGFIIDGKRYASTGSGGNSEYLRRSSGKNYPHNTWVATVKTRNGKRLDVPVAVIAGDEYKPFPGVTWILPSTKQNSRETLVSA
jgi:hypothetical protein